MAGRGRHSGGEGGGSFDSLLDTMTNVVGILVIMLVVTLLGVRDAVRRVKWELPDISEVQLRELRRLAELKQQKLTAARASLEDTQDVLSKLKSAQDEIDSLKKLLGLDSPEAQMDQYKQKVEGLKAQTEKLESAAKSDEEEVERLRKQIASLPESNPSATKVIRMPNPRSPPPGSACVWFMCRYNRVSLLDTDELLDQALRRIASSRYMLSCREQGRVLKVAADDRQRHPVLREAVNWVFDPDRLVAYFTQKDIGNRDHRLSLQLHPTLNVERLFATMRKDGGEEVARLQTSVSRFESVVRDIDKAKQYVRFIVWPDSFEAYVRAREIIERHGVAAGWMLHTAEDWPIAWD